MRNSWLIVGLVVSVALNVFLIGAGAGVIALGRTMARENPAAQPAGALMVATAGLPQPDRRAFRQMLRDEGAQVRADALRSRAIRIDAWNGVTDAKPDAAAIKAKLAESRQVDIGVRTKVEDRIVDYVLAQAPADRAAFAAGMRRVLTPPAKTAQTPAPAATNAANP
jgi:uncharacterized membrane protein